MFHEPNLPAATGAIDHFVTSRSPGDARRTRSRTAPDILGLMALFRPDDAVAATPHQTVAPWMLVLLWTGVGLVFATAGGGVKQALTTWYLWGLLGWALVAIDRRLPIPQERLKWRLLCHVPLSFLFSILYICLAAIAG